MRQLIKQVSVELLSAAILVGVFTGLVMVNAAIANIA
ncbi:hypothetical protein VST7929_01263 [Vibrio stylophorae]|uniref:Aquaporin family protein n=1 Tax=Vibrio stylophorae TaxID=659351 RepID=A0ABN8DVN6_9VIBR|nr:hypothetical protein VST7929_01263 [Vibrio stylophorae]